MNELNPVPSTGSPGAGQGEAALLAGAAAAPAALRHEHFAVVVGIDHYPGLRNLRQARQDAAAFHKWLTNPAGGAVPPINCSLITANLPDGTSQAQARPVVTEVKTALLNMMAHGEKLFDNIDRWERSRLYFYVSGHGMAAGRHDAALLMANAGEDWWGERVSCTEILEYLLDGWQPFREVVVFADCCRHRVDRAGQVSLAFDRKRTNRRGIRHACCYATVFGEAAYEPGQANQAIDELRGYFTQVLLDGLSGEAAPKGKPITAVNLRSYVERRVPVVTADSAGGAEEPEFSGSGLGVSGSKSKIKSTPVVFVAASPGQKKHPVTLSFQAWFQLTDASFAALRAAAVPEAVLEKLTDLKDKGPFTQAQLAVELAELLSVEEQGRFQALVVQHTSLPAFKGRVKLIGGDGEPVRDLAPFGASPGADWTGLQLTQGRYRVQPAEEGDAALLRDGGEFDFTGAPAKGGIHVEEL